MFYLLPLNRDEKIKTIQIKVSILNCLFFFHCYLFTKYKLEIFEFNIFSVKTQIKIIQF